MIEELKELYVDSGVWASPILVSTAGLFIVGSVMLFTVRLIKKFILYSLIALILPNTIGVVGYLEEADSIREAIVERGEEISEELSESAEDLTFSPMYLGFVGSGLTVLLGVVGIARLRFKRRDKGGPEKGMGATT
jgi:hypothetical protein